LSVLGHPCAGEGAKAGLRDFFNQGPVKNFNQDPIDPDHKHEKADAFSAVSHEILRTFTFV
jgi:hypothetical protein